MVVGSGGGELGSALRRAEASMGAGAAASMDSVGDDTAAGTEASAGASVGASAAASVGSSMGAGAAAGADAKLQDGTGQTARALGSRHESVNAAFQMASGREMTITRAKAATKGDYKAKKQVAFSATNESVGGKPAKHHGNPAVLVVDTGTGETKLLAYVSIEGAVQMTVVKNTPSMSPRFRGFDFKDAFHDVSPYAKVSAIADNLAAALGVACQQPQLRSALVLVLGTAPAAATLVKMASALSEDRAPSASLDCVKSQAAPTHPGAPSRQLGGLR